MTSNSTNTTFSTTSNNNNSTVGNGNSNGNNTNKSNNESTPLLPPANNVKTAELLPPTFRQRLVFGWLTPLLQFGHDHNKLNMVDLNLLAPLPNDCQTIPVSSALQDAWNMQIHNDTSNNNNNNNNTSPSLVKALWHAYKDDFIKAGRLKLGHDLLLFVGPQVLQRLVVFLQTPNSDNNTTWYEGALLTLAVTLSQLGMSLCVRHYFFGCYTTGLRIRTGVVTQVYQHALRMSMANNEQSLGQIVNLTSIDAERLQSLTTYLHALWSSPLQISLALFFLSRVVGIISCLGGVVVILVTIPLARYVANWMGRQQTSLMQAKDARVEKNAEVLTNIRVIKFQAWEEAFYDHLQRLRDAELYRLWYYFIGDTISEMLWNLTPLMVAVATFATYVLYTGSVLDVATALTALSLFEILRFPLFMLPTIMNNVVEALVAINRIQTFLLSEQYTPIATISANGTVVDNDSRDGYCCIKMTDVSAVYHTTAKQNHIDIENEEWQAQLSQSQRQESEQCIEVMCKHEIPTTGTEKGYNETDKDEASTTSTMSPTSNQLCLKRINFVCKPGQLIVVVGSVGSGKSTLLNVLLGELPSVAGTVTVNGSMAYFSQEPFILNATVRDNVLFSHVDEALDEKLYHHALDSCALRHDLQLLSHGDMTEIGEKGITLSGGQKARVALTRAVYHMADITLVDDALAAVDPHVGKQLFEEAICGALLSEKSRSVILVTNAFQYLSHPRVDKIVVMQDGTIVQSGKYAELAADPTSIVSNYARLAEQETESEMNNNTKAATNTLHNATPVDAPTAATPSHKDETNPSKLISEEKRQEGHITFDIYWSWAQAAGGIVAPVAIIGLYMLSEGVNVTSNWWLTYWSEHGTIDTQVSFLSVYAMLGVVAAVTVLLKVLSVVFFALRASRKMFDNILGSILEAPMSFFDTTPVGRVINRFSKDMNTLDEELMETLQSYLQTLFKVVSTVIVVAGITPVFTLILVPIIVIYLKEQAFFTVSYRELRRLDSTSRSPIYALLSETVDGVQVIRSFKAERSLIRRLYKMLDIQQHAYFLTFSAQSWLAIRLELIGTAIVTFAASSAVLQHAMGNMSQRHAGLAGLSISYALSVTQSLNWSVRKASDMEANMVAVERIREYSLIEPEGARHTDKDDTLPANWPVEGRIQMSGVELRYRPDLPLVLKGLDIDIPGGCKVGVVGRTGAGKSTLMVSLMRLVNLSSGSVLLDGVHIAKLGLAKLRSSIAVIPQDPILFTGTVRTNLDPFERFDDNTLLSALEKVRLFTTVQPASNDGVTNSKRIASSSQTQHVQSLSDPVQEGGSNYSVGQRQLLVIARALLHGSQVVIMDEATAAVDPATDAAIQEVMRTEFAHATCLTVAHRINTILDSDYILVMSDGRAAEFDTPKALLDRGGMFKDLVDASSSSSPSTGGSRH